MCLKSDFVLLSEYLQSNQIEAVQHPVGQFALTSDNLTKLRNLQIAAENNFATIVNELSILKLFQL